MSTLLCHQFQFSIVKDNVVSLIGGLHPPAASYQEETEEKADEDDEDKERIFFDIFSHKSPPFSHR
jgi:hypothetical protein